MRPLKTAVALAVSALALTLASATSAPAVPSDSTARLASARKGSLSVSAGPYAPGQGVSFTGALGKSGVRTITLQQHMNRPGDAWFAVRDFKSKTRSDGTFGFVWQAPSMKGISFRVVAKKMATPAVMLNSSQEDVLMSVTEPENPQSTYSNNSVEAGVPFAITVRSVPGLPEFAGRSVTLQRRVNGDTWQTLGTSTLGADGYGYLQGLVEPAAGTVVYRSVVGAYTAGGSQVGWLQSFPTYLTVHSPGTLPVVGSDKGAGKGSAPTAVRGQTGRSQLPVAPRRSGASATASSKFGWYPTLYDYSWEFGQPLDGPPATGKLNKGKWQEYSDGTGRVGRLNGAMYIQSQRDGAGYGTTRATLRGAGLTYGRWETRLGLRAYGGGIADPKVLLELVPERPQDYACGKRNITMAEVSAGSRTVVFGAKADSRQWVGSRQVASLTSGTPAVAVEVNKDHITWYWDGKVIGSLKSKKAVSDVPMTMRFSIVGDQVTPGNSVGIFTDWQRAFAIKSGKQVTKGPKLRASSLTTCE